jgi:hypothetical protein
VSEFTLRLTRRCAAPPSAVYELLADPTSHLDWGGARQRRIFRLLTLDAPSGALGVGSEFASTGTVFVLYPTADRNVVTVAEPGHALEFLTDNRYARHCTGRYRNRYDLVADGEGTVITYTFERLSISRPPLHMRGVMRWAMQRFGAPRMFGRGLDNLVTAAEASRTPLAH